MHFITVPAVGSRTAEDEVNRFLASHRVLTVDRQFVADGPRSVWALCFTYLDGPSPGSPEEGKRGSRVDYREELSPQEFQLFARLREVRKALSERDGVPVYAIFTNEQLAQMVRRKADSLPALGAIEGVGPARVSKYGPPVLDVLREVRPAAEPGEEP